VTAPVLELFGVLKDYRALRPLRIDRLVLARGDRVAILGLDRPAAESFVNLITGATLPDRGEVVLFGRATPTIQDSSEWLALVDRLGMVSERAVLLDGLSVVQNLALPFTLEIEPPSNDVRARAAALALEAGLQAEDLDRRIADMSGMERLRVRLGRALALDPALLLLEHPTAGVAPADIPRLSRDLRRIVDQRALAALTFTADADFARRTGARVVKLDAASGRLIEAGSTVWFRRRRSL
jgi:ABC-type transporter Mla maintaining outer membrane lipid asymmetry ATPase subunit MlaF